MTEFGVGEDDDLVIDLEHIFDADDDLCFLDDANNPSSPPTSSCFPDPSPSTSDAMIGQIEEFLFSEDHYFSDPNHPQLLSAAEGFLSDVLLDSPLPPDSSPEIDLPSKDSEEEEEEEEEEEGQQQQQETNLRPHVPPPAPAPLHEGDNDNSNSADADDPVDKKRKRQLRNRDAAVRSRERKKMYVRDLEMKSKYYEAECRRLGMLLQCYLAENHALRLSLHNNNGLACDASTTKQESAVLLLESLLLGSLLWFLGIIGLLILPGQLLSILEAAGVENVDRKNQGSLAPREAGSDVHGTLEVLSFMMSKRCRGSRRKMRCFTEVGLGESFNVSRSFHHILVLSFQ